MIPDAPTLLGTSVSVALALIAASLVLAFVRLLRGPTLPDRVVALDAMTHMAVAFIGLVALTTGQPALLDVAITLALVAFLSTLAFARYVERTGRGTGRYGGGEPP